MSSDFQEKPDPSTETFNSQHLKSTQPPDREPMSKGSANYQIPQSLTLTIVISVCLYLIAEIELKMCCFGSDAAIKFKLIEYKYSKS